MDWSQIDWRAVWPLNARPPITLFLLFLSAAARGSECDPQATWEQMIAAKGGRARLASIGSLFVAHKMTYWGFLRRFVYDARSLYVFPDFSWSWQAQEGTVFGTSARTTDLLSQVGLWSPGKGERVIKMGPELVESARESLIEDQAVFLFETKWVRPVVTTCTDEKIEGHRNRVLHTSFGKLRFDYYLKDGEDLPWRVVSSRNDNRYPHRFRLTKYALFGGLKMPRRYVQFTDYGTSSRGYGEMSVQYEVNPAIDPAFRSRLPSVDAGPDAWRDASRTY